MDSLLGTTLSVFIALTLILMGGCAFMMGQSIANSWRAPGWILPYGALLGAADRFLVHALFDGPLWSLSGYLIAAATLIAIATLAARRTLARRMVSQYPWLYRRSGPLSWSGVAAGEAAEQTG